MISSDLGTLMVAVDNLLVGTMAGHLLGLHLLKRGLLENEWNGCFKKVVTSKWTQGARVPALKL
jgi:hypothetical protein